MNQQAPMVGVAGNFVFDVYQDNELLEAKKVMGPDTVSAYLEGLSAKSSKVNFTFSNIILFRSSISNRFVLSAHTVIVPDLAHISLQGMLESVKVFSTFLPPNEWKRTTLDIFSRHCIKDITQ